MFWRDTQLAFTAFPPLADIPYILFAGHAWDWAASTWHAVGALLTIFLLDQTMRNLEATQDARIWAGIIWISMPTVFSLCGWEYVDLWLCATAAGMAAILSKAEITAKDAWILGLLSGIAMLIKYNGLPLAFGAGVALLWHSSKAPLTALTNALRMTTATIFVAGWWYLTNTIELGHPLYPMGSGEEHSLTWLQYRIYAYDEHPLWAMLAPFRLFFWGLINNPQYFDGMLNPVLLAAFPALWIFRHDKQRMALGIMFFSYFIFALTTGARARYTLPAAILMLPISLCLVYQLKKPVRQALLVGSMLLPLIATSFYISQLSPWHYWQHGRDSFLQRHIPDYALQQWASSQLPESSTIILLWTGGRAYYLHHTYSFDFGREGETLRKAIAQQSSYEHDYILMHRKLADKTLGEDLGEAWKLFLDQTCIIATQNMFELRSLKPCK